MNVGADRCRDNGLSALGQRVVRPVSLPSMDVTVRRARTRDVRGIRRLVDLYATERRLLSKATVALYEDVQEFWVARAGDRVVGCGALHVMWEDLAEVRTVAVDPAWRGHKIGHRIVT